MIIHSIYNGHLTIYISQAKKIKDLIISKNKMKNLNILIEKENYKENAIFSKDMSHIIVKLVLEK